MFVLYDTVWSMCIQQAPRIEVQSVIFIYQCIEKPLHYKGWYKYLSILNNFMDRPTQNIDIYKLFQVVETFIYFYMKVYNWFAIASYMILAFWYLCID